jgi:selenophosphate synthase
MLKRFLETTPSFKQIGMDIGELVADKQTQYGDSFGRAGEVLKVLYPDGIKPEQYTDMLGITRVLDKIFRLTEGDMGEESAWQDITGYGLLGVRKKLNQEEYLRQYREYFGEPKEDVEGDV